MRSARILSCIYIILFLVGAGEVRAQGLKPSVAGYVRRAESYIASNAWNSAKREIDEGLEIIPDDSDLRYLNGYYYYVIGDMNEARYNLVRSVQGNDDQVKAKRLLVDVEDNLTHYSSAICYINELLDIQPYDRDLWRRKIAFYRKLGNDVEADAALERLLHIFPNDTLVVADVRRRDIETRDNILRNSSLTEASNNLERWIDTDPKVRDYYFELISTYMKMGEYERALGAANRGLTYFPNDQELINKAVGIMMDMGRYSQAYTFARSKRSDATLRNLLREIANNARLHDPYEANGRLYTATRDRDALNYLINTAVTRGYTDDAREYIGEAMKLDGRTPALLMKLYTVEKKAGNTRAEIRLLNELYDKAPDDEDLIESYTEMMLRLCDQDFAGQQWEDAWNHLDRVLEFLPETSENWPATVSRQIIALCRLNRFADARALLENATRRSPENGLRFASAYEEQASARLKGLMEEENYEAAYREAEAMLSVIPDSDPALRTLISLSQELKRDDEFYRYAAAGYSERPADPYFIVKQAVALQEQGRYEEALSLLRPASATGDYVNPRVAEAFSGVSDEWAAALLKDHQPEKAREVIDRALTYDPENRELLYTKGLVAEKQKDYELAYDLQHRYFNPSNAEQDEFMQHMKFLRFRGYKRQIEASYTHAFFDSRSDELSTIGHLYSVASVSYTQKLDDNNTVAGQINYKGIDGYHTKSETNAGGAGIELAAQWDRKIDDTWSASASLSVGFRYFNRFGLNLSGTYEFDFGLVTGLRFGYRRTPPTYLYLGGDNAGQAIKGSFNLFMLTPSAEMAWDRVSARLSTDFVLLQGGLYYNVGLRGTFFFKDDDTTSISLLTGFGSFPELSFFEQTAIQNFSRTNTMVGFDARILISRQLALGITGSWNTCFNPVRRLDGTILDSYRNIYSLAARVQIAF